MHRLRPTAPLAVRLSAPILLALLLAPLSAGAQAVDREGRLVDDFLVVAGERSLHVLNAPSPAATSCLPIGEHLAGLAAERL